MAFKTDNMENVPAELTCTKCNKLLSVLPIYISATIGNVCGRCTESIESMITNNCVDRCTAYESLAKYVRFPCSNGKFGCYTYLKHDEVLNHEKDCSYRQVKCPFNAADDVLQCDWKDSLIKLNTHLESCHKSRMIKNPHTFILNKDETAVKINFVKFQLYTFLLVTRYDDETNKLYCLVMCCDDAVYKNYTYQIELGKGDDFFCNFHKRDTQVMVETSKALENVDNMTTIDVFAAITLFGNLDFNVNFRISISEKSNKIAGSTPTAQEQRLLQSIKSILEELECPVCNNYMKTQIYICTNGHSLCKKCKLKIIECPICYVRSIDGRNITLEKLAQTVLYPCQYSLLGCAEVLNLDDITTHESICNFKNNDCLLKMFSITCNVFRNILDPIDHISKEHSDIVLPQNKSLRLPISVRNMRNSYFVTISNWEIFIICICSTSDSCKFNFLQVGMKSNVPMYRYRLEFHSIILESKLTAEHLCQVVPASIDDVFQNCLIIPKCTLQLYKMAENESFVRFQFSIEKI